MGTKGGIAMAKFIFFPTKPFYLRKLQRELAQKPPPPPVPK